MPPDFEVYVTSPKTPDLNPLAKIGDNPEYKRYNEQNNLNFSLKNFAVNVRDTNALTAIWPFWPYPKKYTHNIYLNCTLRDPNIKVKFSNEQDKSPFTSNVSIIVNSNAKRSNYEAKIGALGGDGKYHTCPIHIPIYDLSPEMEEKSMPSGNILSFNIS